MTKFNKSKNSINKTNEEVIIDERLLFLMPLVQIAWSHGIVSAREKRLVFQAAREDGIDERHYLNETLNELLIYQPGKQFFNDCLQKLRDLLEQMPRRERERATTQLLTRCTGIAGATGDERFDETGYISVEEFQSLAQITAGLNNRLSTSIVGATG